MLAPTIPQDEDDRLAELDRLDVMNPTPEAAFDQITAKLAEIFDAPAVMMNLIDSKTQYVKSFAGISLEEFGERYLPRQDSICGHVVGKNDTIVVEDMLKDERFRDNPIVKAKGLRFYAGAPLRTETGQPIGALCLVDNKPRHMTHRESEMLKILADTMMSEVRYRTVSRQLLERTRIIERDLVAARKVQRFLLPPARLEGKGFLICHYYQPMEAIGGDFVDYLLRDDGSAAILIADASGHGASAALTSAMVKTIFLRFAGDVATPQQLLTASNRELSRTGDSGQFMTAAAAIYDPVSQRVMMALAGHPPPILLRRGATQPLTIASEVPLLVESTQRYEEMTTLPLEPGDRVLFFTDGAIEAADAEKIMLEPEGLQQLMEADAGLDADEFLRALFQAIRAHAKGRLKDDVALVCLEVG
jgi:serine phosphatase RsbU (regulator of sigma subunit)